MRRLAGDRRGTVAITTGIALTTIIGFAGLAVDVSRWETNHRSTQWAADNAAYSAAMSAQSGRRSQAVTVAKAVAASMGFVDHTPDCTTLTCVTVNSPPTSGPLAGNPNGFQVIVSQPQKMWLAKLFLSTAPTVSSVAVAHAQAGGSGGTYCIMALNPSGTGVQVWGSALVNIPYCSMMIASNDPASLNVGGSSSLTVNTVTSAGGYYQGSSASLTTHQTGGVNDGLDMPVNDSVLVSDPYAGMSVPSGMTCDHRNKVVENGGTAAAPNVVAAGVYCNGLTFNGSSFSTLSGTYYITGGNFNVQGGAVVNSDPATGATIVLTNGASVTINGTSSVNLAATTTGPFHGFVFFQDRSDTAAATLNGGQQQGFDGILYFPSATLTYSGNNNTYTCTEIIAGAVVFTGNDYTIDTSGCAGQDIAQTSTDPTSLVQ